MRTREAEVIQGCLNTLEKLGIAATYTPEAVALNGMAGNGLLKLSDEKGHASDYLVEARARVTSNQLDVLRHQLDKLAHATGRKPLLFLKYAPRNLAKELGHQHMDFIDATGNAQLSLPWLKVIIHGCKPENGAPFANKPLGTAASLKIIHTLLIAPGAAAMTHREMAQASGVALGSVGAVLRELGANNHLHIRKKDGQTIREVTNRTELMQRWLMGYGETLRRKLYRGSYALPPGRPVNSLADTLRSLAAEDVLLGGELGAAVSLPGELHPASAALHISPGDEHDKIALRLGLLPSRKGNVILLETFGELNQSAITTSAPPSLANELLIYAELKQINDPRVREFSKQFYTRQLA